MMMMMWRLQSPLGTKKREVTKDWDVMIIFYLWPVYATLISSELLSRIIDHANTYVYGFIIVILIT